MCSILDSSVWCESHATVRVWITLLAMKDMDGLVEAALPGLAGRAHVTLEEAKIALDKFMSPDPYSRTKVDDGRRIREVEGGWLVINAAMYRDRRHELEKARKRKYYANHKGKPPEDDPPPPEPSKPKRARKTVPAVGEEGYTEAFEDFWESYPSKNRGSKLKAFVIWKRDNLGAIISTLKLDVAARAAKHRLWREENGRFIPHVTTYLNGRHWQAPIDATTPRKPGARGDVEQSNKSTAAGWKPPSQGDLNVE